MTSCYIYREGCSNLQSIYAGLLHYRALQRALNSATSENNFQDSLNKFDSQITFSIKMITDLHWWAALDKQTVATPKCSPQPILVIESDASQLGWGAQCMDASTGGCWSAEEATHHINYLELLATFLALKTFVNNQKGLIFLRLDNISAVTHKPEWRHTLNTFIQSSLGNMGVVSPQTINYSSRTSSRPPQLGCRF